MQVVDCVQGEKVGIILSKLQLLETSLQIIVFISISVSIAL